MNTAAWRDIVATGWPVLSILLFTSILTFAIVLERWKIFKRIQPDGERLLESVRSGRDRSKIIAWCEKSDQPVARIASAVFRAGSDRAQAERSVGRTIQQIVLELEHRLSTLGTVASVAPFIGLLGTVLGIIRAFRAVSSAGGASAVTLGIAEALVGTAAGLVVAIPALLFYNHFVNRLRRHAQEWEIQAAELVDLVSAEKA